MTRRHLLALGAVPLLTRAATPACKMGIATTSYLTAARPNDAYAFLEHCLSLGAAGIQANLNGDARRLRARADEFGMYLEGMVSLPRAAGTDVFERAMQDAKTCGALCVRSAALGGRRYETFHSMDDWNGFVLQTKKSLDAAIPIAERHHLPIALENHKDRTADELVDLLRGYSSEFLGVCLDFGNNISLLDDPWETIAKLAPYAVSTHVKDMAVAPYDEGFLLSEVLLGQGLLDLPRALDTVRRARPKTRFTLEMITRDPLKVPCLDEKYWATFPGRDARVLARALTLAHKNTKPLPTIAQLSKDAQLRLEEENVTACLQYAKEKLGL